MTADAVPIPDSAPGSDSGPRRVLLTGAAGRMGAMLRHRLARPGRVLRLLDTADLGTPRPDEELVQANVTDAEALRTACGGVDAVVHLAGIPREAEWDDLLRVNVDGTRNLLEAARANTVPRVVLASSTHVVGFHEPPAGDPLAVGLATRPDGYYGFSKAAVEALGSLYHDRFGIDVVCVRVGSCMERPNRRRTLATWLSPDDAGRLFEACLSAPQPGFVTVWGVSANTGGWYSLAEARSLGYEPRDDAAVFAADQEFDGTDLSAAERSYLGGRFVEVDLGRSDRSRP